MLELISKAKRKVRTLEGVRFFDAPIGTPITSAMIAAAMAKHGKVKTQHMVERQKRNNVRDKRQATYQGAAAQRHEAREKKKVADAAARAKAKADKAYAREKARQTVQTSEAKVTENAPAAANAKAKVNSRAAHRSVLNNKQMDIALMLGAQQGPLGRGEGEIMSRLIGMLKQSENREDRVLGNQMAEALKRRMNMR